MMPAWVIEWLPVAPWLGALAIVAAVLIKLWPILRKLGHFLDDVAGEPERPGVPARPGLMERVSSVEVQLAAIDHELHPNSGKSFRDQIDRMNQKLDADNRRIEELAAAVKKEKP